MYPGVTLTGSGGTGGPYTWSATGLPAGLTIGAGTGTIAGTPTVNGTFSNVKIKITDGVGGNTTTTYTVTIVGTAVDHDRVAAERRHLVVVQRDPCGGGRNIALRLVVVRHLAARPVAQRGNGSDHGHPDDCRVVPRDLHRHRLGGRDGIEEPDDRHQPAGNGHRDRPDSRGQGFTGNVTITGTGFIAGGSLRSSRTRASP